MAAKTDKLWVGFDLGGTKMLATLYDSNFKALGSDRKKTKGNEGVDAGLKRIADLIRSAISQANISTKQISGIGIGCPGPLDLDKGVILETPNLGWKTVKIKQFLEKEFGCPTVITNDVDAGVFGEYRMGAARNSRCVVGIFPGTGIGGGCVYEGKILRGKTSSCMEVGHMQIIPNGPLCGCGKRGCLEAMASRLAISAAAAQAVYRGQAPNLQMLCGTDLGEIRSGALAQAINKGDAVIEKIVTEASRYIGMAVANTVHLLGPDTIVLGGGLVEAMPKLILKTVEETARKRTIPSMNDSFQIVQAKLGDEATCMGAAAWAADLIN